MTLPIEMAARAHSASRLRARSQAPTAGAGAAARGGSVRAASAAATGSRVTVAPSCAGASGSGSACAKLASINRAVFIASPPRHSGCRCDAECLRVTGELATRLRGVGFGILLQQERHHRALAPALHGVEGLVREQLDAQFLVEHIG